MIAPHVRRTVASPHIRIGPDRPGALDRESERRLAAMPPNSQAPSCVLVAHASRQGSTEGVAESIAATLRAQGRDVECRAAADVDDLGPYEAVVFGSAVYDQAWLPEGEAFISRHRGALAERPTWLFTVGSFGDRARLIGRIARREPKDIAATREAIRPSEYRVFAGVIDARRWPLLPRLLFRLLGGRFGDNRDWHDIEAWARQIAATLDRVDAALEERLVRSTG
jgi:menaquinone-dependent protoporphyrinogen oxidase